MLRNLNFVLAFGSLLVSWRLVTACLIRLFGLFTVFVFVFMATIRQT